MTIKDTVTLSDERLAELAALYTTPNAKSVWPSAAFVEETFHALTELQQRRSTLAPHTGQAGLADLLVACAQLIDSIAGDWKASGVWSEWDQSVRDRISAALATLYASPPSSGPTKVSEAATHRHKKRGSEYVLIGFGKMQAEQWRERGWNDVYQTETFGTPVDMREVAIYRSVDDGSLWARPREEFEGGRFEALPSAASAPPATKVSEAMVEARAIVAEMRARDKSNGFLPEWWVAKLDALTAALALSDAGEE